MSTEDDIKEQLLNLPSTMSRGQRALEALSLYRAARLAVPDEVLRQIDNCYRHFTEGKPVAFRPAVERNIPSPMTMGEAFGVPDLRGRWVRILASGDLRHLHTNKRTSPRVRLPASQLGILADPSLHPLAWRATGKRVYVFVTRRLLGWRDREGAGDRQL